MYIDHKNRLYTTWRLDANRLASVYLDYPEEAMSRLKTLILEDPKTALQPLLCDFLFIDQIFLRFHRRQMGCINALHTYENERSRSTKTTEEGLRELSDILHRLAVLRGELRRWDLYLTQLSQCEAALDEFAVQKKSVTQHSDTASGMFRTVPGVAYLKRYRQMILNETENTEHRAQAQLTLMMHRISIDESRHSQRLAEQSRDLAEQGAKLTAESKKLGEYTALLARQTSADSASMITIAAVTMFFLPATFVSVSAKFRAPILCR